MFTWRFAGGTYVTSLPCEQDAARGRLLEAGDHAQRRRLAAARRAEQREELALADPQVEIVDDGHVAEALGHAVEHDVSVVCFECHTIVLV